MTKEIELHEVSKEQIVLTYFNGINEIDIILKERELRNIYHSCKDWENNEADHNGDHVQTSGTYSYEYFIENIYLFQYELLEYIEKI